MSRVVIVRYGEIALKSKPVRARFKRALIENMEEIIGDIPSSVYSERGRIFVDTDRPKTVALLVSQIPGVVSASPAWRTESSIKKIVELSNFVFQKSFPSKGRFAVRSRRTGRHEFGSQDISERVGSKILDENPEMEVNLDNPDHELFVEIRNRRSYVFTEVIDGRGGLPVGTQGKALLPMRRSRRSLASAYLMLKRGVEVLPLLVRQGTACDQRGRAMNDFKSLLKFHPKLVLREISFDPILNEVSGEIPVNMRWIVCYRIFFRLAEKVARKLNAKSIILDFTSAEISSYKLDNIGIMEEKVKIPIFYPLSGMTDDEVSRLVEKVTYSGDRREYSYFCKSFEGPERAVLEEVKSVEGHLSETELIESVVNSLQACNLED